MKVFSDASNRQWEIKVNVNTIKRVRALLNLDIVSLIEKKAEPLGELLADPIKLVDMLYVLCQEQAQKANVSDVQFGEAMVGGVLEEATTAFVEELIDFFPNAGVRKSLRRMMEAGKTIQERVGQRADREFEKLNLDDLVEKLISESGKLPASAESPQEILRFESSK